MILYVGGHAAGMDRIIKEKYNSGEAVIEELHLWIREELLKLCKEEKFSEKDYDQLTEMVRVRLEELIARSLSDGHKILVICADLIGSGVVPIDSFDRCWREVTGRVLTQLAAQAQEVYRVICGVEQRIK